MSTISAVTVGSTSNFSTTADSVAARLPQKTLGQQDFLKLLATQFQVQDPMKPMEDTAFIAQMAQFSALEQSSSMVKDMSALRADQQLSAANSYLGHRVTVDTGKGTTTTADVTAIDISTDGPRLVVEGKMYPLSSVLRVEPGLVTAPAPQPVVTGGA